MLILSERIFAHLADQASSVGFFSRFSLSHSLLNRCYSTMTREPEDQALAMANLRSRHPIPVFVAEPSAIATLLLLRLRGSETLADLAVGPLTSDSRILGLAEILGDGGRGGGGGHRSRGTQWFDKRKILRSARGGRDGGGRFRG